MSVALATLAAPVAQAAPAAPAAPGAESAGLLVGTKVHPDGGASTATENPDGSRYIEATSMGGGTDQGSNPGWSPDGKRIVLQTGEGGMGTYAPDLTDPRPISYGIEGQPVFTPDGTKVIASSYSSVPAFQLKWSPADWNPMDHQGESNLQPWFAASTGDSDSSPTVSPTGTVLFQHGANGSSDIWTDHGNHTAGLLIANGGRPHLSPDGATVAFVRTVAGNTQLFVQASDGSGTATQVTSGAVNHDRPKWTSDGLGLFYNANPGTDFQTTVGHRLVLATKADTLTPGGLIDVQQQPAAVSAPATPATFHSTTPTRLLDTRSGLGRPSAGAVQAGGTVTLPVAGLAGIPSSGVSAVVLNVTVTGTTGGGHVTVWGDATARPTTSNLNWDRAGQTISNLVTVPVPVDGALDFFTNSTTQVIADVQGYYTRDDSGATFTGRTPTRVLDTRTALGTPTAGPISYRTIDLKINGQNGVPAGATAVVLNLTTAFTANSEGYLEAYPAGTTPPTVSNVNWSSTGALISGLAIVPVGADGSVSIKVNGTTDVVADVFGYFTADAAGARFSSTGPARLLDTRTTGKPVTGGSTLPLQVAGANGVPSGITSVVLNLTVTDNSGAGFLEAWADGTPRPPAGSNVNWVAGQTIANQVIVPVGADGKVNLYVNSTTHVIADIFGYFGN
ncbi:hypothetical protein AB0K43_21735 [Kitasatospora sp. NPDC049258]|uniref:TolB family protein n=1 Tax=Kitasatospora sp. NPDC049258 TaxID=3155394 RepID=UPI0034209EE2